MKTSIQTVAAKKFFVVDTEIPVAAYREGITRLSVVTDEKEGTIFTMGVNMDAAVGEVSKFGVIANGKTDDGNFAILIPVAADDTVEDIKKTYGSMLVSANTGLVALKDQMVKEAADVDAICEGLVETEADATEVDAE